MCKIGLNPFLINLVNFRWIKWCLSWTKAGREVNLVTRRRQCKWTIDRLNFNRLTVFLVWLNIDSWSNIIDLLTYQLPWRFPNVDKTVLRVELCWNTSPVSSKDWSSVFHPNDGLSDGFKQFLIILADLNVIKKTKNLYVWFGITKSRSFFYHCILKLGKFPPQLRSWRLFFQNGLSNRYMLFKFFFQAQKRPKKGFILIPVFR